MFDQSYDYQTGFNKIKLFFSENGAGKKVLDVAAGDGRVSVDLLALGYDVWALDYQKEALDKAKSRGLKIIQADIRESLPIENEYFDYILALDILEHLVSPVDFIEKIKSKLKNNGQLIISIPNHFDLRNRLSILFGKGIIHWGHRNFVKNYPENYEHIRFFRLNDLENLLNRVGLFINIVQLNFMAGGIIPRRVLPKFFRRFLLKKFPNLFSGKFIVQCSFRPSKRKFFYWETTPQIF